MFVERYKRRHTRIENPKPITDGYFIRTFRNLLALLIKSGCTVFLQSLTSENEPHESKAVVLIVYFTVLKQSVVGLRYNYHSCNCG
jgi:hypothetical protein